MFTLRPLEEKPLGDNPVPQAGADRSFAAQPTRISGGSANRGAATLAARRVPAAEPPRGNQKPPGARGPARGASAPEVSPTSARRTARRGQQPAYSGRGKQLYPRPFGARLAEGTVPSPRRDRPQPEHSPEKRGGCSSQGRGRPPQPAVTVESRPRLPELPGGARRRRGAGGMREGPPAEPRTTAAGSARAANAARRGCGGARGAEPEAGARRRRPYPGCEWLAGSPGSWAGRARWGTSWPGRRAAGWAAGRRRARSGRPRPCP